MAARALAVTCVITATALTELQCTTVLCTHNANSLYKKTLILLKPAPFRAVEHAVVSRSRATSQPTNAKASLSKPTTIASLYSSSAITVIATTITTPTTLLGSCARRQFRNERRWLVKDAGSGFLAHKTALGLALLCQRARLAEVMAALCHHWLHKVALANEARKRKCVVLLTGRNLVILLLAAAGLLLLPVALNLPAALVVAAIVQELTIVSVTAAQSASERQGNATK